jgi:hypothetical protein
VNEAGAQKFDIVIMDVNYEEENIELNPPKKFLETKFLQKLLVPFISNSYTIGLDIK